MWRWADIKFHLLAFLVVTVWGSTFVMSRILIQGGVAPASLFLYRFLISYVALWFFAPRRLFADSWRDESIMFLLGLTGGSLYFVTENSALGITQASNVAIIIASIPLMITILSKLFRPSEPFGKGVVVGGVVALLGVALAVFNGSVILHIHPLGDILTLVASLSWAIYSLLLRSVGGRYSILFITRKTFFYGIVSSILFAPFVDFDLSLEPFMEPINVLIMLYLSLGASLFCFLCWGVIVKRIGVVFSSNYIYLNPVVSLVLGALLLDERITLMAIMGVGMILLGVFISERSKI